MQLSVEDVQVYVLDKGTGQPILFLHGNPDSADMWHDVIEQLAPRFRCLAIDLPGFGRSRAPADFDLSLEHQAQFIDKVVTAIGITEPLNIVAHDFGAHYGLAWAVRHPAKVGKIAVMNTNFFSDYKWHSWARAMRTPLLGELMVAMTSEKMLAQSLKQAAPRLTTEQLHHTYELYPAPAKRMALRMYRFTEPANFRGWEDELLALARRVPLLVLWGDKDPFISPAYAERFGAQHVAHFADYSHWLPLEAPGDVAQKLRAFFGDTSA